MRVDVTASVSVSDQESQMHLIVEFSSELWNGRGERYSNQKNLASTRLNYY